MSTILKGDKVRVKVSKTKMATPWAEQGTLVETAYKFEESKSKEKADTTVFLDSYKTAVLLKSELGLTLTCRQATGDAGQDIIQECEEANEDFYIAVTKDYTANQWKQYKVACESYTESLEVSSVTDVSYTLQLAPGAEVEKLQPAE